MRSTVAVRGHWDNLPDVMNRRALLGTGLGLAAGAGLVIAGAQTGRLDEAADALGLDPRRLPADSDESLRVTVVNELAALVAATDAGADGSPEQANKLSLAAARARIQLKALGSPAADLVRHEAKPSEVTADLLAKRYESAAGQQASVARKAVSASFVELLASISAGSAQTGADLAGKTPAKPERPRVAPASQRRSDNATTALERCLAVEHNALYAYSYIGGRLKVGTKAQKHAESAYELHRLRRETLRTLLRSSTAVAPKAVYPMPSVTDADTAARLGADIESGAVIVYLRAAAATEARDRAMAIAYLQRSAVEALGWGQEPVALPGTVKAASSG